MRRPDPPRREALRYEHHGTTRPSPWRRWCVHRGAYRRWFACAGSVAWPFCVVVMGDVSSQSHCLSAVGRMTVLGPDVLRRHIIRAQPIADNMAEPTLALHEHLPKSQNRVISWCFVT